MAFPLAAIATIASTLFAGRGKREQQGFGLPEFRRRDLEHRLTGLQPAATQRFTPTLRGPEPSLASDPILSAMLSGGNGGGSTVPAAAEEKKKKPKDRITEAFLNSLLQNVAQRVIFGGGQPAQTFAPPTFR